MYFAADKLFDNISEEMWSVLERALSSVLKCVQVCKHSVLSVSMCCHANCVHIVIPGIFVYTSCIANYCVL